MTFVLKPVAGIHAKLNRLAEARNEIERCLQIGRSKLEADSAEMASNEIFCGFICLKQRAYADGVKHCEQGVALAKKTLGAASPIESLGERFLACGRLALDDREGALAATHIAEEAFERSLNSFLSFTSEEQRLKIPQSGPFNLAATLGDAPALATMVLRIKGVILDSLLEDRAVMAEANHEGYAEQLNELRDLKRQLFRVSVAGAAANELSQSKLQPNQLRERIERIESGMAQFLTAHNPLRHALNVKTEQVQAALSSDTVLVEFLRYDHVTSGVDTETRYGAVIIPSSGAPKWVCLGQAGEIEKTIELYQKSVRGKTDETVLRQGLRDLYDRLWAPIEAAFPSGIKKVVLSPDGQLNFVSFAILLTGDETFVANKYFIRYVASGRDLIKQIKNSNAGKTLVFANPDFGDKASDSIERRDDTVALRSVEMRDFENTSLRSLAGTEDEAKALQKHFGESVKLFLGANATKAQLEQIDSPRILHLATHGFFLPEIDLGKALNPLEPGGQEVPKGKLVNPMHRSGLALAGARETLQAWSRGETPPIENNGIVTAEEVGGLKLNGTWLVVLSACDTGLGEARAGEGVMGLRRGFIQAGAQNLLMTLWPISDQTTVQIMLDFYDAAEKTHNAPQALADTQRDWLVRLRNERGLLPAVQLAGPFIMSSQGNLKTN